MAKHTMPAPRAQRGETLSEVLVALLIAALATMLLATMTMASSSIDMAARQRDEAFYSALTRVEAMDDSTLVPVVSPASGHTARIQELDATGTEIVDAYKDVTVDVYTVNGLTLYKDKGVGP